MAKFEHIPNPVDGAPDYLFYCPGCKCNHGIWTQLNPNHNGAKWQFNGDVNAPTITPSVAVNYPSFKQIIEGVGVPGTEYKFICHSFITNGQIQYLSDTTHELSGQTIDLPKID